MATVFLVWLLWLPLFIANTEGTTTATETDLLISTSTTDQPALSSTQLNPTQRRMETTAYYNFSCYNCHGVVGEVTNCGESLTAEEDLAVVGLIPCNTVCTKAVSYKMDQKIYVTRNCSLSCDPGCTMRAGTGTCWYCCQGNICNSANPSVKMPFYVSALMVWSLAINHLSQIVP